MRVHPHLLHFIRSVATTELHDSTDNKQTWKDLIIKAVIETMDFSHVRTQEQLHEAVDTGMNRFRAYKLEPVLEHLTAILKQIPLDLLK